MEAQEPHTGAVQHTNREKTGVVEISEIVDEHYARARVLSGDVGEGNMVELEE
jgi:hypothetical protein